jgi:hypothetical protein
MVARYKPASDIKLYVKGSTTIEARQWSGTQLSTYEILWWTEQHDIPLYIINSLGNEEQVLQIGTPQGIMTVHSGDYIIREDNNSFYPTNRDIFLDSYKRIENDSQ